MAHSVVLRPMVAGDLSQPREPDGGFDDFGPRTVATSPRPARLDDDGALIVLAEGEAAGSVSWRWGQWGPNASSRCPMIGIYVDEPFRGRGIGTTAQTELVDLFFRHTRVNRVEAHTDVANIAEQKALERAGFTREGCTRGAQWRDGEYRDGYLYAVVRADWLSGR